MNKNYSLQMWIDKMNYESVHQMLKEEETNFARRFGFHNVRPVSLILEFENHASMTEAYQELKLNVKYAHLYKVHTDSNLSLSFIVSGKETIFDYLGSNEPNLLTLSRDLGLQFRVKYLQPFSSTLFEGEVVYGELLSRQCLVYVSDILPELSLGLLGQIGQTDEQLNLLLTRFVSTKAQPLI